jgi:hypothetical protein
MRFFKIIFSNLLHYVTFQPKLHIDARINNGISIYRWVISYGDYAVEIDRFYLAEMDHIGMITAGCFYGDLQEFKHRINNPTYCGKRHPIALAYYNQKFEEFQNTLTRRSTAAATETAQ